MNNVLAISYVNIPLISNHQQKFISLKGTATSPMPEAEKKPSILFITSYPPRECGIATYSQDLIAALHKKFNQSYNFKICALESNNEKHTYNENISYTLDTDKPNSFIKLAKSINENDEIDMIMIQHEFGFFDKKEDKFQYFLNALRKPIVLVFHTVLPQPGIVLRTVIRKIVNAVTSIIVMTKSAANILIK
jgi:glycosyltransferase involved in cell wall biosynthesis